MSPVPAGSAAKDVTMTRESSFQFACHPDLPCFTQCCADVNIYLTPYDVLRLRRALKLGSEEFLAKYTRCFLTKVSRIPVVQLAMDEQTLSCKLVTDSGCRVYADRPWACRMYPLDPADQDGQYRFIVTREQCLGLGEKQLHSVQQWLDDQGVGPYLEMERAFGQLLPPGIQPGQDVDPRVGKLVFLAYDLDQFSAMLEEERFRDLNGIDNETLACCRKDDEALLSMAFQYIRRRVDELL